MIALNSDTETRPTDAMREVIAQAAVGDEQRREDPSINALCEQVASLLGKPAAVFLPTGTMCNVVAVKTHTNPGDLLLAQAGSHVLRAESGGAAMLSGVMTEPFTASANNDIPVGTFTPDDLDNAMAVSSALHKPYGPPASLLCVEQTHNFGGGSVWPLAQLQAVADHAREIGLRIHMDGARLMNASIASGVAASEFAACTDSVWIDFTKGLGAPLGAVLAGSAEFIDQAWRYKTAMGGAMRQAGIAAAACSYALTNHVERLADDHRRARTLADALASMPGISLVYGQPQSNIVYFNAADTGLSDADFAAQCLQAGLRVGPVAGSIRAVTHLDISDEQISTAIEVIGSIARQAGPNQR